MFIGSSIPYLITVITIDVVLYEVIWTVNWLHYLIMSILLVLQVPVI